MTAKVTVKIDERGLRQALRAGVDQVIARRQPQLDRLSKEMAGRPLSEAKAALKSVIQRDGGKITDPELTQWAEVIARGDRVVLGQGR